MSRFTFEIESTFEQARAARLAFQDGQVVETPVFMPVGTQGTVKALTQPDLEEIGYKLILGNTYHLYLRPGNEVMSEVGGLKKFMAWPHKLLTDSGGYQAFSLSELTRYKESGVEFRSHLDGSTHLFSPEKVLNIQKILGSDIVMPIDDCAPYPADNKRLKESLARTHQWIKDSYRIWQDSGMNEEQSLFAIAQGGVDLTLREHSAKIVSQLDLPGYAIGGLSVGEKNEEFIPALEANTRFLPEGKPRYLMGVGSIKEIVNAVAVGTDMFDCVLPTRNARNGQVFTSRGKVNLRNEVHKNSTKPIDVDCACKVCQRYSLAYLRHLHKSKEILAFILSTYHNLYFMYHFMLDLRESIADETFVAFRQKAIAQFS